MFCLLFSVSFSRRPAVTTHNKCRSSLQPSVRPSCACAQPEQIGLSRPTDGRRDAWLIIQRRRLRISGQPFFVTPLARPSVRAKRLRLGLFSPSVLQMNSPHDASSNNAYWSTFSFKIKYYKVGLFLIFNLVSIDSLTHVLTYIHSSSSSYADSGHS